MNTNLYSSKPSYKPLKGGQVSSISGTFDTITVGEINSEYVNIPGFISGNELSGVSIINSVINSTPIGLDLPSDARFNSLRVDSNVTFGSFVGSNVIWNANTGQFYISSTNGSFRVDGCSRLGNIEICQNNIKSVNLHGNINIEPNGLGTIYLSAPIYNRTSNGNYYSELTNGGVTFIADNDFLLYSSSGNSSVRTFGDQTYTTVNGDIELNVETGLMLGSVNNVRQTSGSIFVQTNINHNLNSGDIVSISNGSFIGGFTVGSILSDTRFSLTTTTGINTVVTGGNFIKTASNNIILNSSSLVKIPQNTRLTFGDTCNSISGITSGLLIKTCEDVQYDMSASKRIKVPDGTALQFGTSSSTYINYTNGTLNISSNDTIYHSGTLSKIQTTNTKFYDPILSIADYTTVSNDGKDRGIEFNYYDASAGSMKLGWFGYKNSTQSFTFIPDAVNNNEVISGSSGNFEYSGLNVNTITMLDAGIIDVNCGKILNASLITGCSNNLTIAGSSNVTITTTNRLSLQSGTDILIPRNIPLKYGTSGTYISENTSSNLVLSGSNNIQLFTITKGSVIIPVETSVSFDGTSVGSQRINSNTSGDLVVYSNKNIFLTTTGGNIIIPSNTRVQLGDSSQSIYGSSGGITLVTSSTTSSLNLISNSDVNISSSTGNIILYPSSGSVRIPSERRLVFNTSGTGNSIVLSSGTLTITGNSTNNVRITNADSIDLNATSSVNIPTNTRLYIGNGTEKAIYTDISSNTYISNNNTSGSFIVNAYTTNINNTGGVLNVINTSYNISSSNFYISGTTGSLTQINSENTKIRDPIVTIGDYTLSTSDAKDRGIEYRYYDNTAASMKLGWFGRKDTTKRLTYYSDAINTNEVITGTIGDIEVATVYAKNINFTSGGYIDLSCGTIANVNTVQGCSGVLNLKGTDTINATAANINLNASSKVVLPYNIPLSFGETSNSISCDSSGNMLVTTTKVIFNADIQVNGTTTSVYSTVTNIQDPIFSIGGVTGPIYDDNKDRGIEFKWNDGSVSKVGFFGYKDDLGRFVFIRDGINNNEVFSGAYSDVQFGNGYFTNLNLSNGVVTGVKEISGGEVTIKTTAGNVYITPTSGSNVIMPYDSKLSFGSTQNSISSDTSGNVTIFSQTGGINFSTSDFIRFPGNTPMYIGTDNTTYFIKDTSGNFGITNSSGDISLTPKYSTGNILIPTYNYLGFGSTNNSIYSDGEQLVLNGYTGISLNSSDLTISGNVNIIGSLNIGSTDFDFNKYILPLGTYQLLTITSAIYDSGTSGNIRITTSQLGNLNVGDSITIQNCDAVPDINATYTITNIIDSTNFNVSGSVITTSGTEGTVKSNLTTDQNKDVGIQVNYWSTTGNSSITSGSAGYKTGFFGFKESTERWSFYSNATISNNVVTGQLGDIEVNKVNTSKMSGFVLEGGVSCGSNTVSGTDFKIGGGSINDTPIGVTGAASGRFSTLVNTVQAELEDVTFKTGVSYTFERYQLDSSLKNRNPTDTTVISMFSVVGTGLIDTSGTMPSTFISDGTYKIIMCSAMGTGCMYTLHFGDGKLITPNPISSSPNPTKLVFKRRSQSAQLVYDAVQGAWILLTSGCYVQ